MLVAPAISSGGSGRRDLGGDGRRSDGQSVWRWNKARKNAAVLSDCTQKSAKSAQEQPGIRTQSYRAKSLLAALDGILGARCEDAAVLSALPDRVFDREQFGSDPRSLPLSSITRSRRVIRGSDEKKLDSIYGTKVSNVSSRHHGFDDGNNEHVFVRLLSVLEETLSPAGCAFATDSANPFRRIEHIGKGLLELRSVFDPWNHDAIRSNIQRAFHQTAI